VAKPEQGKVKQTVIQEQFVDADEVRQNPAEGMSVTEYMATLSDSDWQPTGDHIAYVYRLERASDRSGPALEKIFHSFDEFFLRDKAGADEKGYGGGIYRVILKKGSQRIKDEILMVDGQPRRPGDPVSSLGGKSDDVVVRLLDALKANDPQRFNNEAMLLGFKNSIEMMRAAQPQQMSMKDMVEMMVLLRKEAGGGVAGETPAWLVKLGEALIPVGVGLLTKILEPKDQIATLRSLSEAISIFRGANAEPESPDITTELLRNGPKLLTGVGDILEKLHKTEQLRFQRQALEAVNKPSAPGAAPATTTPAAIQAARASMEAAAVAPIVVPGAPAPGTEEFKNWLAENILQMVKQGDDGQFVFNWFDQSDPQSTKILRDAKLSIEQLDMLIASGQLHPKLADLAALPNYKKFLTEFYAAMTAAPESVPA